jgi:glycine hydroxymethyltransferase
VADSLQLGSSLAISQLDGGWPMNVTYKSHLALCGAFKSLQLTGDFPMDVTPRAPMYTASQTIAAYDPELAQAMESERIRQEHHIELIASENYTSPRVMQAQGSVLTNKYAEGYPGKRYYGGCEFVDIAEQLAIDRLKQLYGASFANVQPHSGSQANAAVYLALLNPHDTLLGMSLDHGGHLTHGAKVNFSGKIFNAVSYGIDQKTGEVDYEHVRAQAKAHQPKLIVAGFSAYSRILDWAKFRQIADEVGAYFMVDMAHVSGLVAAGLYPNPVPHAHVVTSTTHKSLRGPRGGFIISSADESLTKKFNSLVFPGTQGGPLMHVIAAKAVAFKEALEPAFKQYQTQVLANAKMMAKTFMDRGISIVSNGTDNHLFLVDMVSKNVTGKDADKALGEAFITVNKNAVPNDPRPPMITSGVRIGTPAVTTRGFKEAEVKQVALWIADIIEHLSARSGLGSADGKGGVNADPAFIANIRSQVKALCERFPVYSS